MLNPPTAWNWRALYWVFAGAFLIGLLVGQMKAPAVPAVEQFPVAPAEAHWGDR